MNKKEVTKKESLCRKCTMLFSCVRCSETVKECKKFEKENLGE